MNIKDDDFDIPVEALIGKVVKSNQFKPKSPDDVACEGEYQQTLFYQSKITSVFHNNEWYFSIVDALGAITESAQPSRYWSDLKKQLSEKEGVSQLFGKIEQLKMPSIIEGK